MRDLRIVKHPVLKDIGTPTKIQFTFNDQTYSAFEGDTIAYALLSHGVRTLRRHESTNTPRGIYCNIGHCFECRVAVGTEPNVRACLTLVENNMIILSAVDSSIIEKDDRGKLGGCTDD